VQTGQVEGVVEHAGVHLGRHASGRREQFPVMGEFTGLARAQAQRRQCGRCPATGQADQRLSSLALTGVSSGSVREPSSTGAVSAGKALVSDGGTKISIVKTVPW
jgi:hypothetical protein